MADNQEDPNDLSTGDGEDFEDYRILEESPCGRWNKSDTEISVQKLLDFDTIHVGIDTEKGVEIAWNEMKYVHAPKNNFYNRFDEASTLKSIYSKLKCVLEFLLKLDHSNILKFYDYWYDENETENKVVVITEYSTAGSLKKVLDKSRISHTKVKSSTSKRWLNQVLYSVRYLHSEKISIFQGFLSSDTIFIQNSCVIKLTPTLLRLNGVCEMSNNTIRRSNSPAASKSKDEISKPKIMKLNNEIIQKDINAIGEIALEIFTAHLKQSRRSTTPIVRSASYCEDFLENDFVTNCLDFDATNIDGIWHHPFINNIYSLKVLSVYSILAFFQNKNHKNTGQQYQPQNSPNNNENRRMSKFVPSTSDSEEMAAPQVSCARSNPTNIFHRQSVSESQLIDTKPNTAGTESQDEDSISQENLSSSLKSNLSSENLTSRLTMKNNISGCLKQRRKVSLSFLSNFNNITIPQDFFTILDDIRVGLYPRLFNESEYKELTAAPSIKSLASSTCLEFIMQQKQIIDIRSSLLNINNTFLNDPERNREHSISTIVLPSFDEDTLNACNNDAYYESERNIDMDNAGANSPPILTTVPAKVTLDDDLVKEFIESRRIESKNCSVSITEDESQKIEISLNVRFEDNSQRMLQCMFPNNFFLLLENYEDLTREFDIGNSDSPLNSSTVSNEVTNFEQKIENICLHLTNELVDYGLLNKEDHMTIHDLFINTIKTFIF